MRTHECIHLEIFSEAAQAAAAPDRLAAYYKCDPFEDVQLLMEHLCRNRTAACVEALVVRGVERSRLQ